MFKCIHVCSSIKGDGVLKDQITNCLNNNVKNNPYQHWPTAFEHIQQGGLYAPAFPRTAGPSAVVSVHRTTWWPSNCWGTPWTYQTFLYPFFPLGVALSAFSEIGLAVMDFLKEMQLRNWLIIVSNTRKVALKAKKPCYFLFHKQKHTDWKCLLKVLVRIRKTKWLKILPHRLSWGSFCSTAGLDLVSFSAAHSDLENTFLSENWNKMGSVH